jgi:catechol 2,3-dioxygenase-like lactoylglutathione lyase family enzyme
MPTRGCDVAGTDWFRLTASAGEEKMLGDIDVMATVAVKDIERARRFYVDQLGLEPRADSNKSMMALKAGRTALFVYESQYAGTNQATAATWTVADDVDDYVQELRTRGVTFEHYDFPGSRLDGDVHHMGAIKGAWFKDPDGNIFHIVGPENAGESTWRAKAGSVTK